MPDNCTCKEVEVGIICLPKLKRVNTNCHSTETILFSDHVVRSAIAQCQDSSLIS